MHLIEGSLLYDRDKLGDTKTVFANTSAYSKTGTSTVEDVIAVTAVADLAGSPWDA